MDCALTPRPVARLSFLLINVFLLLAPQPARTQQLGSTFPVEERQTAVARVFPGEFVRARLTDGSRAGGPLVDATPVAFTLGPSVAYSDNQSVVRLVTVDSLWVRAYSSRRGAVIGGGLGGLLGLGLGMGVDAGSMCPTTSGTRACAQSAGDPWRWRWRESAGTVGRRSRRPILPAVAAPLLARIIEAEYPAEHPGQGGRDRCPLRRG